jgi:hypothetical protein
MEEKPQKKGIVFLQGFSFPGKCATIPGAPGENPSPEADGGAESQAATERKRF